ncbi:ANK1, partial [Symbiodinium sp. CCMP2456]
MGGGRRRQNKSWQSQDQSWNQPQGKWQYWSGSWPSSPRWQRGASSRDTELRYDSVDVSSSGVEPQPVRTMEHMEATFGEGGTVLAQEIQKSLNQARKADIRVRKVRESVELRKKQWAAYARQMKNSFLKQRQSHEADLKKLEQEEAEATAAGRDAAEHMQALALYGVAPVAEEGQPHDTAWEQLLTAAEPEQPASEFLSRALATARQMQLGTGPRAPARCAPGLGGETVTSAGPVEPGHPSAGADMGVPPRSAQMTHAPQAIRDPYLWGQAATGNSGSPDWWYDVGGEACSSTRSGDVGVSSGTVYGNDGPSAYAGAFDTTAECASAPSAAGGTCPVGRRPFRRRGHGRVQLDQK